MSTSATRSVVSELRVRIARLEGRAVHQRAVLPFGLAAIARIFRKEGCCAGRCMRSRAAATTP